MNIRNIKIDLLKLSIILNITMCFIIIPFGKEYSLVISLAIFFQLMAAQLLIVFLAIIVKARKEVTYVTLFLMFAYLLIFYIWAYIEKDGTMWLGYFYSLPLGILASFMLMCCLRSRFKAKQVIKISIIVILTSIISNQMIICKTLMYCGF